MADTTQTAPTDPQVSARYERITGDFIAWTIGCEFCRMDQKITGSEVVVDDKIFCDSQCADLAAGSV